MTNLLANATNPAIGIMIFMIGGLAGAIFYMPLKKVKNWAWESYWMIYAVFGLLIVPWILALTMSPNVFDVLKEAPKNEILYCFICGALWGFGGLTWGLMIRYLGVGLGLALGCGICSAAGTLIPPMLKGSEAISAMFTTTSGIVSVIGALVSVAGIVFVGMAGMSKENELPEEEKKKAVAEFDFKKGIIAVLFSGLMSSAMSFGLQGGGEIEKLALITEPFTTVAWKGMPVLVVVLLGGFVVNAGWCLILNIKNKTTGDYVKTSSPILPNLIFAGIAGTIWCSQFICFKTGEPQMGDTSYIGWAVLMASAILFSQILGLFLGEWKGTSKKTMSLLGIGLFLLVISAIVAGYSGHIAASEKTPIIDVPAVVAELNKTL
ncbi:MAG: rhamnose/proton symporter RhaT [Phycisphaerae bacterium]|nr:rhamnose/proton symporter RhaT [Phycisphaerae bacterium]